MRKFFTLLSREIRSYFYSPIAYIVLVFFLLVSGVDFYFQISFMNQRAVPYSVQEAFFNSVFFWFAFVLIFPLITMRLFAEEFKLGTIEPLMTAPVRDWQVVLAKFFGALFFYIILWIPTAALFRHLPGDHASAGGQLDRRLSRRLSHAPAPRDVLPLDRLFRLGPDEEPDRGRDHFLLPPSRCFSFSGWSRSSSSTSARRRGSCSVISPRSNKWAPSPAARSIPGRWSSISA